MDERPEGGDERPWEQPGAVRGALAGSRREPKGILELPRPTPLELIPDKEPYEEGPSKASVARAVRHDADKRGLTGVARAALISGRLPQLSPAGC